jgi:small subunit ribosomal protein S6
MRMYELMIVLKPTFQHDSEKTRTELVTRLLADQTVDGLQIEDYGKKDLAYEIQKQTKGAYLLVHFKAQAVNLVKLEQQVKLTEDVMRYLLTKVK